MRMRNPKDKDVTVESCDFFITEDLFNNENKICLEIGMGKGDFILNMALLHPDINYIGVEKYTSVAVYAIKKIREYNLDNVKIFIGDVLTLPEYLKKKIDTIYLNFSDPWPKARHEKRRLSYVSFLEFYDTLFQNKSHIIMKTDNDDLFAYSRESFLDYGYIIKQEFADLHAVDFPNVETEYERKFSNLGFKIKYIDIEKDNN